MISKTTEQCQDLDLWVGDRTPDFPPNLAALFDLVKRYVHLDDYDPWLFGLATAVSSRIPDGDPLWGMIVGPASGGKTEVLRLLDDFVDKKLDEFTNASLLSWMKERDEDCHDIDVPTGILPNLPNPGFITIGDFSTVLAGSAHGGKESLYASLRRIYDGSFSRSLANVAESLTWQGKVTALAACTSAIDNQANYSGELGPRWLYLRLEPVDIATQRAMMKASRTGNKTSGRKAASKLAMSIINKAVENLASVDVDALDLGEYIEDAALVAAHGRASVPRESWGSRDINGLPEVEGPTRLQNQLVTLTRCLLALDIEPMDAIAIMRRAAGDSMPQIRKRALCVLATASGPTSSAAVARAAGTDRKVTTRALGDLEAAGLVEDMGDPYDTTCAAAWVLTEEHTQRVRGVLG